MPRQHQMLPDGKSTAMTQNTNSERISINQKIFQSFNPVYEVKMHYFKKCVVYIMFE